MAASNLTSTDKFNVYDRLAQLNRSFDFTTDNLVELRQYGILDKKMLETFCGLAKELQSQINCKLLATLHENEDKDAFEFGKVRIARDHYLNAERPAFKQGKRRKR
ncbi:MAG TPA: hypothetical protein VI636_11335 [Candidatus Angelobacter sp.]